MEKGYYGLSCPSIQRISGVAIHNKNGKGLLLITADTGSGKTIVAIHNKNGKGLLQVTCYSRKWNIKSQSTIKMEKGYYTFAKEINAEWQSGRNPQ